MQIRFVINVSQFVSMQRLLIIFLILILALTIKKCQVFTLTLIREKLLKEIELKNTVYDNILNDVIVENFVKQNLKWLQNMFLKK